MYILLSSWPAGDGLVGLLGVGVYKAKDLHDLNEINELYHIHLFCIIF